jgi:hypothetical protein
MSNRDLFPKDRRLADRLSRNSGTWAVIALLVLFLVAGLFYGWSSLNSGSSMTASSPVSGQATSKAGSTTSGAPPGTPPSQTTGQATAPTGSTTTGSNAKR